MKYNIYDFLSIQQGKYKQNAWEEVENKLGITFPKDYKMFIDSYGEGGINEFLWILSPFSENENLNSIEKFKVMKDAYISMQREFPEQFSFDFYNGKTGLFPWGITDNGDELFWNYKGDVLEIVVYESRYANNMSYIMSMEDFLCGLLSREIVCPIFPDDFILEKNYYETI
ncbi:MAG: SMI1/KNR4 family protein [Tyzzerella sp.]|nr:SMI1/KNR4 family protein [Tyzzerella sp.]